MSEVGALPLARLLNLNETQSGVLMLVFKKVITELGVGKALVSLLDEKGRPSMVERAFVLPPHSRMGPVRADERTAFHRSCAVLWRHRAGQYKADLAPRNKNDLSRGAVFQKR